MIFLGKYKVLKNYITACDYNFVLNQIKEAVETNKDLLISPIASHTLTLACRHKNIKKALDSFNLLVPDSYWVKKSLQWLYNVNLRERVYGPNLMMKTCQLAEKHGYKVFLYGTTDSTLKLLKIKLKKLFPKLLIVGTEQSKFRELTIKEKKDLIVYINKSQTNILFIGLGSPLQETFAYDIRHKAELKSLTILTVGVAFNFISEKVKQAPCWMGNNGFEWLYRLVQEPRRLARRYLLGGPDFIYRILIYKIKLLGNNKRVNF